VQPFGHAIIACMSFPQEIEAKYRIDGRHVFADLLALHAVGPFELRSAPSPVDQVNTYYDTASRLLRSARHGFRVRLARGRYTATLKGPARLEGEVHIRSEWEQAVPDADPAQLPPGELHDHLLGLTQGELLTPLLVIRTRRHTVEALRDGQSIAELALDESIIEAAAQSQTFYELEIELLGQASLSEFMALTAELRDRYGLQPEEQSKLQRGLALIGEDSQ
jgi:inorganic triphosphatase YgiF